MHTTHRKSTLRSAVLLAALAAAPAAKAGVLFQDGFSSHLNNWSWVSWDKANQSETDWGPWSLENGRITNCTPSSCPPAPNPRRAWTSVATNADEYTIDADVSIIGATHECKIIFSNAHVDENYRLDLMNATNQVRLSAPAGSASVAVKAATIDDNATYHVTVQVKRKLVSATVKRAGYADISLSVPTQIFPDGKVGVGTYLGDCDFDNFTVTGTEGIGGTANLIPVFGYERTEACDEGPANPNKPGERLTEQQCDRPLFSPWNRDDQNWWNVMVEEMNRSGITTVAAHNRGCTTATDLHGEGDMCPNQLPKLMEAIRARGGTMRVAMFDDFQTVGQEYKTKHDGVKFDFGNQAEWESYLWARRWDRFFANVPVQARALEGGRPLVFVWLPRRDWGGYADFFTNAEGHVSEMIKWLRARARSAGVDPFIVVNQYCYDLDSTLRTSADPDRRPDNVFSWFEASSASGTSVTPYEGATVAPGFRSNPNLPGCGAACNEVRREHGHQLISALEQQKGKRWVLLEGWTNVVESAGFYRSLEGNDPRSCTQAHDANTVDFPGQVASIVHRYASPGRTSLALEAEAADEYFDVTAGNQGGLYRANPNPSCTMNDLDITREGSEYFVGWVTPREWLKFRDVYLPGGRYTVNVRYAIPPSNTNAQVCARVGSGQRICSGPLPQTGAWNVFGIATLGTVDLNKGLVDVRVDFPGQSVNVDKLIIHNGCDPTDYRSGAWNACVFDGIKGAMGSFAGAEQWPAQFDQTWSASGPLGRTERFSVEARGTFSFPPGTYVFHTRSDDGVMVDVKVDGIQDISNWTDHGDTEDVSAPIQLSGDTKIVLRYYQNLGGRRLKLWWEAKTGGDLYAFNRNDAGSNSTAVHVLTRASNYQAFSLQAGTALEKTGTDGSWQLLAGDYNGDGVQDVYAIKKANTGSGRTEVHVLNGANLSQFLLHIATPLGLTGTDQRWVFQLADFNRDGKLDLYAIDKLGASSAEVHVLDGAGNFQAFLQHSTTAVPRTAADHRSELLVGDYNQDGQPDLYWIYRSNTGTRTTEVHVANGANLGAWLLETGTVLGETGTAADHVFSLADYNGDGRLDVVLIKKANTGTVKTEVHVLNGAGNFQQWLLQTGTALGMTGADDGWQFDL